MSRLPWEPIRANAPVSSTVTAASLIPAPVCSSTTGQRSVAAAAPPPTRSSRHIPGLPFEREERLER
ncbi:MAG: hypothetical protein JW876_11680 [Candidatus Krumholzibacteriota bacterium]|nr:hypothetical protein [Candidatus Krumholzibacteriota bacterium]